MTVDALATRFNPPFPLDPTRVTWMKSNPYTGANKIIEAVRDHPRFRDLAVAVIDLTGRTRRPDGAGWMTSFGWNMDDERFAASLVKIAAMYAAFRLRHNLRIAANEVNSSDPKEIFRAVATDWKDVVETA